jgi:flavodoxin short chain
MKNISVIYWSATGNTEKMALAVADGARDGGNSVKVFEVSKASKDDVLKADAVALGCPSMGAEVLEEEEMEPFVQSLESENLKDKPMVLFGSYDWGDGQWMREWDERMKNLGVKLVDEGLIIQNTPDAEGLEKCRQLGAKLANS